MIMYLYSPEIRKKYIKKVTKKAFFSIVRPF